MKKILLYFIALITCFLAPFAKAENFYINNYNVDIKVTQNNLLKITEDIDTYFTSSSHGIFRTIPLVNDIERADGSKGKTYAGITNLKVSEQSTKENIEKQLKIKIGNPNEYIKGRHFYRLSYDYQLSGSNLKDKDEFYFNIIGDGWNTKINHVNFKITMPKEFLADNVGLSIGKYGTKGFKNGAYYKINPIDNTIVGSVYRTLNPHEALTIRIELPKGYFTNDISKEKQLCIFLIIVFTLASFVMWYIYGKDDKVIPVVNFYPPENLTSAQIGIAYRGEISLEDVTSLILYLATKGYIKIKNYEKSFSIELLKPYDGTDKAQSALIKALFKNSSKENIVTKKELETSRTFYKECIKIGKLLRKEKDKLFYKNSLSFSTSALPLVSILGLGLMLVFSLSNFNIGFCFEGGFLLLFPLLAIVVISAFCSSSSKKDVPTIIFICVWSAFFGGAPLIIYLSNYAINVVENLPIILFDILALIISSVCLVNMPKRTRYGNTLLGNILGFKKFLETAEKRRIEELMLDNPMYCFDILPYAYILGIAHNWIKKIEDVVEFKPKWYEGELNVHAFDSLSKSLADVSVPSTSNGGVSHSSSGGGGGCSGGGSGGGGGGSW